MKYFSFIETPDFTKRVVKLLSDEELAELQMTLIVNPEAGNLIIGGAGLRKIRWRGHGHGKRGGVRIIYYFVNRRETIWLLDVYGKMKKPI